MMSLINSKVTYVWCFLAVLTGVSWVLGDGYDPGTAEGYRYVTIALLVLAFFKTRLVIMYFMEVLNAPLPLRGIFEGWVIVVCGILITLYLTGGAPFV
ncbi:MAG: cytochrome C oxidase subunit IV family protein [Halieaceae bacterium]|nr:cytochrome C oxidase subunit IV family protein [Halieaceae bacterium]